MKKIILGFVFISLLSGLFSSCATYGGTKVGNCPSHDKNYFRR